MTVFATCWLLYGLLLSFPLQWLARNRGKAFGFWHMILIIFTAPLFTAYALYATFKQIKRGSTCE